MKPWAEQIQPHRGASHTLRALDTQRLLCSCGDVLIAADPTPAPPALHAPDRCPAHPGQRAGTCGACRADELAAEQRQARQHDDSDAYAIGAAAARAALAQVAARRRGTDTEESTDA